MWLYIPGPVGSFYFNVNFNEEICSIHSAYSLNRQATFSNLTYLELYTSLQECFDKLVIYHEIRSDLFICNYMIVKE